MLSEHGGLEILHHLFLDQWCMLVGTVFAVAEGMILVLRIQWKLGKNNIQKKRIEKTQTEKRFRKEGERMKSEIYRWMEI
jgi:hypothetical protein